MKDATKYEKKLKKLLTGLSSMRVPRDADDDPVRILVVAVMEANATTKLVQKAMDVFERQFVDFNELRVAQPREIVEMLGKSYPHAREKAIELTAALNGIFQRANDLSMAYMGSMAKRDLRRHLGEIGLSAYAAARVVTLCFDGHGIAADRDLVETLQMDGYAAPDADLDDVQGFLERVVPQKHALAAHQLFRRFVAKRAEALAKKRKAEEVIRLAAERKAAADAAKAAKAAAEAEAKEKAKAEAKKKAKVAKRGAAKSTPTRRAKAKAASAAEKKAKRPAAKKAKRPAAKAANAPKARKKKA